MEAAYPDAPGFRDKETSRAAAESLGRHATVLRRDALAAIMSGPKTAFEVAQATGHDFDAIQPRVSELLRLGKVRWNGLTRCSTRSKRAAKVWECVK